eukprot:4914671-Pyramimonas_sp.AAC.1
MRGCEFTVRGGEFAVRGGEFTVRGATTSNMMCVVGLAMTMKSYDRNSPYTHSQVDTIDEEAAETSMFTGLVVFLSAFVIIYPVAAILLETLNNKKGQKVTSKNYNNKSMDKLSSLNTFKETDRQTNYKAAPSRDPTMRWSRKVRNRATDSCALYLVLLTVNCPVHKGIHQEFRGLHID